MPRPGKVAVGPRVRDGMACEARLRIGFRCRRASEQIGDGALARPRAADHGQMQRRGLLAVQKRADAIAHERRSEPQAHGLVCVIGLPAAMLFEPAEVVSKLANQHPAGGIWHESVRYTLISLASVGIINC